MVDQLQIVRHKQKGCALLDHRPNPAQGLRGKPQIAHRESLVDQEDLRLHRAEERERQSHEHAGRVELDRPVEEVANIRERANLIQVSGCVIA